MYPLLSNRRCSATDVSNHRYHMVISNTEPHSEILPMSGQSTGTASRSKSNKIQSTFEPRKSCWDRQSLISVVYHEQITTLCRVDSRIVIFPQCSPTQIDRILSPSLIRCTARTYTVVVVSMIRSRASDSTA